MDCSSLTSPNSPFQLRDNKPSHATCTELGANCPSKLARFNSIKDVAWPTGAVALAMAST